MAGFNWNGIGQRLMGLQGNPLLHMGLGLLQAGQWSDKPQGIGSGLLAGMQNYQAAAANRQAMQMRQMQMQAAQDEIDRAKQLKALAAKHKATPGILGYGLEAGTEQAQGLLQPSGSDAFDAANLAYTNDALNSVAPAGQAQMVQGPRGFDFGGYAQDAVAAGLIDPLELQKMLADARPKVKEFAKTDKGIVPLYDTGEAGTPLDYRDPTKKDDLVQAQDKDGNLVWITPEQALAGGFAPPREAGQQVDAVDRKIVLDTLGKPIYEADVGMNPYQAGQLDVSRRAEQRQQAALGAGLQQAQQDYELARQRVELEEQRLGQASEQAKAELALKQQQLTQAQAGVKPGQAPKALPQDAQEKINQAFTAFRALDQMAKHLDETGRIKGNIGRVTSSLGLDEGAAAFQTARKSYRLAQQAIIPGIPSNFDQQISEDTIPEIGLPENVNRQRLAFSKQEFDRLFRNTIAYYKGIGYQIPPEIIQQAKAYGVDVDSVPPWDGQGAGKQQSAGAGARKTVNVGGKRVTATQAPDGNFYVQQNGKFYRVD